MSSAVLFSSVERELQDIDRARLIAARLAAGLEHCRRAASDAPTGQLLQDLQLLTDAYSCALGLVQPLQSQLTRRT